MARPDLRKIVIFSGSGVSAESGLPTFGDARGLWRQYAWEVVTHNADDLQERAPASRGRRA